jgi:hypothetical protein
MVLRVVGWLVRRTLGYVVENVAMERCEEVIAVLIERTIQGEPFPVLHSRRFLSHTLANCTDYSAGPALNSKILSCRRIQYDK